MTETTVEEIDLPEPPQRRLRLDWILPVLIRPAKTLREIVASDTPTWLAPVLLLSVLAVIFTLVAGPLRVQEALSRPAELPTDFQFWSPDAQQKYIEANTPNTGRLMMYGLPGLGALASVWVGWFLLGAVLHLGLTFSGGRGSRSADFNLAAWASLPFALRWIVQIGAMLITNQLITYPGLSGFFPQGSSGLVTYLAGIAALFDIYLVWQFILLVVGASASSGITRAKALGAVLASVLILLVLEALPGFLLSQLSGLSVQRPFFF
jgi:hypothetical protein